MSLQQSDFIYKQKKYLFVSQEGFLQKVRQHEKILRGPLPRAQACAHITCSVFKVLEHFGVGTLLEFLPPYRMSTYEAAIILIDTERGREIFNVGRRFALALADRLFPTNLERKQNATVGTREFHNPILRHAA
jgi:hypothetical protein